jgi:hypothetical protein
MANRTRDFLIKFLGDSKDLERANKRVVKSTGEVESRFGKLASVGNAFKALWATAVAGTIAKVAGELVALGQKAEAIRRRFAIVFGESAKEVEDWADSVNESFGIGEVAVQDMAAQVQDLLVPLGFLRSEAADVTKEVLTSAAALSQWTGGAVTVEDAAERIRKALLGEREGLEAVGIKILESTVQARLLAKGQDKLIGNDLERAKVLATLELLQEKSTDAMGAYTDQTDEAAAAQRDFNAAYQDAKQELGDKAWELWATAVINAKEALEGANKELALSFFGIIQFIPGVREMIRAWDDSTVAQNAAREASIDYHEALDAGRHRRRQVVDDTEDYAQAARDAQTALAKLHEEQEKDLDPVLKLIKSYDRLNEAHAELAELQAGGEATSTELRDAQLDVLEAQLGLNTAADGFRATGDNWKDSFAEVAAMVGFTADEIARLIGLIDEANGKTVTGGVGRQSGPTGPFQFDSGGVVPGRRGKAQLAVVHGGETILPTHKGARANPAVTYQDQPIVVNQYMNFTVSDSPDALYRAQAELERALDRNRRGIV